MKRKSKFKKRYLIIIIILLVLSYYGPKIGLHSWSEHAVLRYTLPNQDGNVVYEQLFGNKKVVIWDTGKQKYVKLIENTLGFLYYSTKIDSISAETPDGKMMVVWSGTKKKDGFYDTLFAVEVKDEDIVKVVISNDNGEKNLSLNEIKENSTHYVEMEVKDGLAANYSHLPYYYALGSHVFRGINSEGRVVSLSFY